MSEAMLSMVLDIEVARHKRELADGFAKARERLIPKQPDLLADFNRQTVNLQWASLENSNYPYNDYGWGNAAFGGIFWPSPSWF